MNALLLVLVLVNVKKLFDIKAYKELLEVIRKLSEKGAEAAMFGNQELFEQIDEVGQLATNYANQLKAEQMGLDLGILENRKIVAYETFKEMGAPPEQLAKLKAELDSIKPEEHSAELHSDPVGYSS